MSDAANYIEPPGQGAAAAAMGLQPGVAASAAIPPPATAPQYGTGMQPPAPLAPGFERSPQGDLTLQGRPPDTVLPGGNPAWETAGPQVHGAPTAPQIRPPGAPQGGDVRNAVREASRQEWLAAGYPPAAVEGILRNQQQESGFNPYALGDYKNGVPTSGGGMQHHNDRRERLFKYLDGEGAKGANLNDPVTMARLTAKFSIGEMAGGDSMAAKARETLMHETDPTSAYSVFRRAFERSADANGPVPMSLVAHDLPPAQKALLDQFNAAGARERDQITQDKNGLMRMALAEPPGSAKRQRLEDEMHQQIAKREAEWEDKWKNPPVMKPVDALENFGSVGTIVALIGGLFARRHMTAALGAAGQAMQAINQNNYDKYQQNMKVWELQTRSAMETIKMQREDLQSILHDDDKAWDHKMALLAIKQKEYGMDRDYAASERGDIQTTLNTLMTLDRSQNQLKNIVGAMSINNHTMFVNNEEQKYYEAHPDQVGQPIPAAEKLRIEGAANEKFPLPGAPKPSAETQTKDRAATARAEVSRRDAEWAKAHPDATDDEMQKQHFQHATEVDKTVGAAARQPRNAPAMALQTYIEEQMAKGHTPSSEELQNFAASTAEKTREGATVGNRAASLEMASNAANAIIPLLRAKADKIDLGRFPDVNSIVLAAQQRTGGTDVVQYGELINSMRYLYARALSPTGQARVADLQHFDEIMNKNWSKDQINAGLDQIQQTLMAEKGAIATTREEVRSGGMPSAPAPSLPRVTDQTGYEKLAPGSHYLGPDGLERVKK